jgi:hypothetical protein
MYFGILKGPLTGVDNNTINNMKLMFYVSGGIVAQKRHHTIGVPSICSCLNLFKQLFTNF